VFAALVLPLAAAGCSVSTPEREVREFIKARVAGNDGRAAGLTVEGDLSDFAGGEPFLSGSGVTFDLDPAEFDDNSAVVVVHYRWDDSVVDVPYVCLRTGTKWKVSLSDTEEMWLGESAED
jgi:hypothetical protein